MTFWNSFLRNLRVHPEFMPLLCFKGFINGIDHVDCFEWGIATPSSVMEFFFFLFRILPSSKGSKSFVCYFPFNSHRSTSDFFLLASLISFLEFHLWPTQPIFSVPKGRTLHSLPPSKRRRQTMESPAASRVFPVLGDRMSHTHLSK